MLLLADDDGSPEPAVGGTAVLGAPVPKEVCAVPGHVLGRGHGGVIWERDREFCLQEKPGKALVTPRVML